MNTENMTKKLAIFYNTKLDFDTVIGIDVHGDEDWSMDEYVRTSEWMVVEFKSLPVEKLAEAEMAALTEIRAKTVAEFTEKLSYIDGRMANLRALTGPVQS